MTKSLTIGRWTASLDDSDKLSVIYKSKHGDMTLYETEESLLACKGLEGAVVVGKEISYTHKCFYKKRNINVDEIVLSLEPWTVIVKGDKLYVSANIGGENIMEIFHLEQFCFVPDG